jgi:hypothetical protein
MPGQDIGTSNLETQPNDLPLDAQTTALTQPNASVELVELGGEVGIENVSLDSDSDTKRLYTSASICVAVDLFCWFRFLLVYIVLLDLLGGPPLVLFLPLSGLAMFDFIAGLLFFLGRDFDEPDVLRYIMWANNPDHASYREPGTSSACINRKFGSIFVLCWYPIGIIVDAVGGGLCFVSIFFLFTDADDEVVPGRQWHRGCLWAALVIFGIAFLARLVVVITLSIYLCCCTPSNNSKLDYLRAFNHFRAVSALSALILTIVAFVCVALAGGLSINSYLVNTSSNNAGDYTNCEPMLESGPNDDACAFPFPSSHWLRPDSSTKTGYRVSLGARTLPLRASGGWLDPDAFNAYDGFSVAGSLLWHLEHSEVTSQMLVPPLEVSRSLEWTSPTLLVLVRRNGTIEVDSNGRNGSLALHFSEVDELDPVSRPGRLNYIQPARALIVNSWYVAVVQGMRNSEGTLLPPTSLTSRYIKAYKSGDPYSFDSDLVGDARFERFRAEIFPLLEGQGVNLAADVQLLWDFHTASQNSLDGTLVDVRSAALQRYFLATRQEQHSDIFRITKVSRGNCSEGDSWQVQAYIKASVPWFLKDDDGDERDGDGRGRARSGDKLDARLLGIGKAMGYPQSSSFAPSPGQEATLKEIPLVEVGLALTIPCSINVDTKPNVVIDYGQGLFENRVALLEWGWLRKQIYRLQAVAWSTEWRGFSTYDLPLVSRVVLWDGNAIARVRDGLLQGFTERLVLREMVPLILSSASQDLGLDARPLSVTAADLVGRHCFLGVSMGAILGGGLMPFQQGLDDPPKRATLLMGGAPFTFLIGRSALFRVYIVLLDLQFYSRRDVRLALTLWQLFMDPFEASLAAATQMDVPTGGTGVLLQAAEGDATVPTIATNIMARDLSAFLLAPALAPVFDLPQKVAPFYSALQPVGNRSTLYLTSFTEDQASLPAGSALPTPNNVHNCFPQVDATITQANTFFKYGVIEQTCSSAPCVYGTKADC